MIPMVICAVFRRCGIYPFNPQVIDCSISTENPEASLTRPSDEQTETENGLMENGDENTVTEFSTEQEQRFQTRFEEGYDLMDSEYLRWLEINHPDSVPADRHMLVLAPESCGGVSEDNPTLTDVFLYVSPLIVTEYATSSNSTSLNSHASTTESAKTCPTPVTITPHTSAVGQAETSPTLGSSVHIKTPVTTPSSTPSSSGTSSGKSDPELRYISKYLVQVISNATPKRSTSAA